MKIGSWHFEESRHRLRRGDEVRHLEPKAVAVLARLLATPGEVVTKDDLLDTVWTARHVTEEVLTNAIYQLRQAFGDDARSPRYIETIPRRGYRLCARIESSPASSSRGDAKRAQRRWLVAAIASGVLVVVVAPPAWRALGAPDEAPPVERLVSRGWGTLDSARPGAAQEAGALAREALALDPDDADAWALAATAWAARAASEPPGPSYAAALDAAQRALTLSPGHPRALLARARARWLGAWDWAGAERDLAAALSRAPESPDVWRARAELAFFSGRPAEAREALNRALARHPGSVRAHMTAGLFASLADDVDTATRHYRAVLARHPDHPTATRQLAKLDAAPAPRSEAERLERLTEKARVRPGHVALWHVEDGDEEAALDWLERAVEAHDATVLFFRFDPRWDPLRHHPRYREAMRRAGVPS